MLTLVPAGQTLREDPPESGLSSSWEKGLLHSPPPGGLLYQTLVSMCVHCVLFHPRSLLRKCSMDSLHRTIFTRPLSEGRTRPQVVRSSDRGGWAPAQPPPPSAANLPCTFVRVSSSLIKEAPQLPLALASSFEPVPRVHGWGRFRSTGRTPGSSHPVWRSSGSIPSSLRFSLLFS